MPSAIKVTLDQAQNNATAIRAIWKTGRKYRSQLRKFESADCKALKHGRKGETYTKEAERLGLDANTANIYRRVADEYTPAQIDAICTKVEKRRSRFSATHLRLLMRLKDRQERDQLMETALKDRWSTNTLELALRARGKEDRPYVGREPAKINDPHQRMLKLGSLANKFWRFCQVARHSLPADLASKAARAEQAVDELRTAIILVVKNQQADRN